MKTTQLLMCTRLNNSALLCIALSLCPQRPMQAQLVTLQTATATFSQTIFGGQPVAQSIDGNFGSGNGWGIATSTTLGGASSETAVWETVTDLNTADLTFTMHFLLSTPQHLLGRFRFSVTTDNRSLFADGSDGGGDVSANWVVLANPNVLGPAGMTFTTLGDQSVLAGGTVPNNGAYTVKYSTPLSGVTGFRLESLEDSTLPGGNGPGFGPANGNFILTELQVSAGIAGDYNEDGTVDAADYVVWRKTIGTQDAYNVWRANFGQSGGSGSGTSVSAAVPEPARPWCC